LLKFGTFSSRYKDVFDIYYLLGFVDKEKLKKCFLTYIFDDSAMRENDMQEVYRRVRMVFSDRTYVRNLKTVDNNWLGEDVEVVLNGILTYLDDLSSS